MSSTTATTKPKITKCSRCGAKDTQVVYGVPLCLTCIASWYCLRDKLVTETFLRFVQREGK